MIDIYKDKMIVKRVMMLILIRKILENHTQLGDYLLALHFIVDQVFRDGVCV